MAWDWLQAGPGRADPIRDALKIADKIDSMPDTAAVFNTRDIDIVHTGKIEQLLVLNDSWLIPMHLSGTGNDSRFKGVNPNYRHVGQYADAPVKCECGAVIATENEWYENEYGKCQMDDGVCDSRYVANARADLWNKRYDIMVQSAELLRSPDYVRKRFNVEQSTLSYIAGRMHVSRETLRDNSVAELKDFLPRLREDHTANDLARVFNRHPSTIRRWWKED